MKKLKYICFILAFVFCSFFSSIHFSSVVYAADTPDVIRMWTKFLVPWGSPFVSYSYGGLDYSYRFEYVSGDSPVYCAICGFSSVGSSTRYGGNYVLFSDSPFSFRLTEMRSNGYIYTAPFDLISQNSNGVYSYSSSGGINLVNPFDSTVPYFMNDGSNWNAFISSSNLKAFLAGNFDGSSSVILPSLSFDSESAVYDSSLGYIQNLKRASLALGVSGGQTNRGFYYDRFNFSTVTSSGKQIFDEGFDVQYGFSAQSSYRNEPYLSVVSDYYYLSDNDLCPPASLSNGSDDIYNSLLLGRLWVSKDDRAYADIVDQALDGLNFIQNTLASVKVQLWLRPVYFDGANSTYGEWTVYQFESSSSYSGTTDDGGIADDGRLDSQSDNSNVSNSTGIGETVEDAGSSASSPSVVDVDLSDVSAVVGQFTNSLTAFGGLFSAFFSFLPPWVTFMFIAALSVSAIMIVWKAVH